MLRRWLLGFTAGLTLTSGTALAQTPYPVTPASHLVAESGLQAAPAGTAPADPAAGASAAAPTGDAQLEAKVQGLETKLEALSKGITVGSAFGDSKIIIGGAVVADLLFNEKRVVAPGTPFFLAPDNAAGRSQNTFDGSARQTNLSVVAIGPKLCDEWDTSAVVAAVLFDSSVIKDRYGVLPLMAYGEIRNQDWRFTAGLQHDTFSPLDPTMLEFSKLAASGNPAAYRLHAQATRYFHLSDDAQIDVTAGVSDPTTTIYNDVNLTLIEDNGWPNIESRVALELGPLTGEGVKATRPIEVGVSGVIGQLRRTTFMGERLVADVWGVCGDWRAAITDRFGIRGEIYVGQALGEYNGAVFQTLGAGAETPIRTSGGWLELYYYLCPEKLRTHVGYGIDDPIDRDLNPLQITRNDTYFANLIWNVNNHIQVGCEAAYRKTAYVTFLNNEGFGFMTQFQWKF